MPTSILVTYASKHGATREIAERVAAVLGHSGLEVDVKPVEAVSDPTPYRAIVLGTAMYMGFWMKSAKRFLVDHEAELAQREVWMFVSGPTGEGDAEELMDGHLVQPVLEPVLERIAPRDVHVFHGAIAPESLGWFERFVIRMVKADTGDFRDWQAIDAWAERIASALATAA